MPLSTRRTRPPRSARNAAWLLAGTGLLLASLSLPAEGADVARLPDVEIQGQSRPLRNVLHGGSVLVISVTVGGSFTDGGPAWLEAVEDAAYTADLVYDPQLHGWPDLSAYSIVVVVYNDVWWPEAYGGFGAADEAVLASYPGGLAIIGQDYIRSTGHATGPTEWLLERFQITEVIEDMNFGDVTEMTLTGSAGGPFAGLSGVGSPCFAANPWFTDDVLPDSLPTQDWSTQQGWSGHGGAAVRDGIFSTNAYECFSGFPQWVAALLEHLSGALDVQTGATAHDAALRLLSPNPVAGRVDCALELSHDGRVSVSVYDVLGRLIQNLLDRELGAGHHRLSWELSSGARSTGNGVYYLHLKTGGVSKTLQLVFLE